MVILRFVYYHWYFHRHYYFVDLFVFISTGDIRIIEFLAGSICFFPNQLCCYNTDLDIK